MDTIKMIMQWVIDNKELIIAFIVAVVAIIEAIRERVGKKDALGAVEDLVRSIEKVGKGEVGDSLKEPGIVDLKKVIKELGNPLINRIVKELFPKKD